MIHHFNIQDLLAGELVGSPFKNGIIIFKKKKKGGKGSTIAIRFPPVNGGLTFSLLTFFFALSFRSKSFFNLNLDSKEPFLLVLL